MNNVTTDKRRNQLASEYNCHITKYFSENLMAIKMKKKPSILICQYFGIILLNQNIKTEQNYATQTLTALLFILKQKIFMKTLLMMFKNGLTHKTTANMVIDRF